MTWWNAWGAAVITSISGKGIIAESHPQAFGVTGSFGNPVAKEMMQEADLVFFIGCKAGQLTTFGYRVPRQNIPVIHLDSGPEEISRNYPKSAPLVGDAGLEIEAVIVALKGRQPIVDWNFER